MEETSWRRYLGGGFWRRHLGEASWRRHLGGGIWRTSMRHLRGIWETSGGIWEASGEYLETRRLREAPTGSGEEKMLFSIVKTMIFVKSLKNISIS